MDNQLILDRDSHPGRPKILFVGQDQSTHTHAWMDLLAGSDLNVRFFALPVRGLPLEWRVEPVMTRRMPQVFDPVLRKKTTLAPWFGPVKSSVSPGPVSGLGQKAVERFPFLGEAGKKLLHDFLKIGLAPDQWLAAVIRQWRPDVIHTLGLDPAGFFYHQVRKRFSLDSIGSWICQLRGGSDLTLTRRDPAQLPRIAETLQTCDRIISDNPVNMEYAREMGLDDSRFASLSPIPGTGGVDVDRLAKAWQGPPSNRKSILFPKAYESPWSKSLPVFEALKIVWDRMQPSDVLMTAAMPETRMWFNALPPTIRDRCRLTDRIPRSELLDFMTGTRVMLAPSLVDGIPNILYEAMACGAFPVVSPLETIAGLVKEETNVLFARNLYPDEIAGALARAMNDDDLVDRAAGHNLELVKKTADRQRIGPRVVNYYFELSRNGEPRK